MKKWIKVIIAVNSTGVLTSAYSITLKTQRFTILSILFYEIFNKMRSLDNQGIEITVRTDNGNAITY